MTQQTAVQWLESQLNIWQTIADEDTNTTLDVVRGWIDKLKAMEKEQIKLAFSIGMNSSVDYFDGVTDEDENYYNETFNK